jgi:signal transduction histidine kinase
VVTTASRQFRAWGLPRLPPLTLRSAIAISTVTLLFTAGGIALALTSDHEESPVETIALSVVIGFAFVGSGLIAWARRAENRTGLLMVLVGLSWYGGALNESNQSLPFTLGYAESPLVVALFIHLVLAFPPGRLETRGSRAVVIGMYALALVAQPVFMLFDDLRGTVCDGCPANAFLVDRNETVAAAIEVPGLTAFAIVLIASVALLIRRWRAATPPLRRVLTPVYATSGATLVILGVANAAGTFSDFPKGALSWVTLVALLTVPLSFLAGLLRTRLARSSVGRLVVELGETPPPGQLRDALGRALGDPSLGLAYWLRDDTFVDVSGHPVTLPGEGSGRVATLVERSGRCVAALVHDASLGENPELVDAVVAAAGLALENERLQAELRARLDDLRASRARFVATADNERRRLERNLHDGAQQRLVALSLSLRLAQTRPPAEATQLLEQASAELAVALEELRELARGIHPAVLTERGLQSALESLAARAPIRVELVELPEDRLQAGVEAAAYYFVAEALTNVAKYADASEAIVRVTQEDGNLLVEVADDGIGGADPSQGSGLRGLADRIEALEGHLELESPPGRGTRIRAQIPCQQDVDRDTTRPR